MADTALTIGPSLYRVSISTSDGSYTANRSKMFLEFDKLTGQPNRVRVYNGKLECTLDEPAVSAVQGDNPRRVNARHQITLADGRVLFVMAEAACSCSSKLRWFAPENHSGWRP